jgi:hypothetical protein
VDKDFHFFGLVVVALVLAELEGSQVQTLEQGWQTAGHIQEAIAAASMLALSAPALFSQRASDPPAWRNVSGVGCSLEPRETSSVRCPSEDSRNRDIAGGFAG